MDGLIGSLASQQIPVTALGYGLDYDELLLARAARSTGGHYQFIEKPEMLAAVFEREVLRLRHIVAQGAVLVVTPGPGIRVARV